MSSLVLNLIEYPSTVRHGATETQCLIKPKSHFRESVNSPANRKCKQQGNNNFIHVHQALILSFE